MGAWGSGPFDNDDASDWVYEVEGADDLELVRDALREAAEATGYLDAGDGTIAIAAAETLAAAAGSPPPDLPEEIEAWIESVRPAPTRDDLDLARRAVDRVRSGDSELAELWQKAAGSDWGPRIDDLVRRLRARGGPPA